MGGYGRLFADQVDLLVTGQVNSFAGAFVQIFLLMALLWRSLGAAAVCLVPNVAPLYFIFALMGAVGIHLDMATVMIAGVVLGITVDDTIHLYHGYQGTTRQGRAAGAGHREVFPVFRAGGAGHVAAGDGRSSGCWRRRTSSPRPTSAS